MYRILMLGPVLPVLMVVMNIYVFVDSLHKGRFKINPIRFAIMYSLTIVPAAKGDISPFVNVLSTPSK